MTDTPPRWPSYRAALADAVRVLDRLRDKNPCVEEDGRCTVHPGGAAPCRHGEAQLLMDALTADLPPTPYPPAVLLAILRGLTAGQDAFVTVAADGHAHTARLRGGYRGENDQPAFFYVTDCHPGERPLDPADILTLEVRFTGEFGRTLTDAVIADLDRQIAEKTGEATP